jgi:hypothetical protein
MPQRLRFHYWNRKCYVTKRVPDFVENGRDCGGDSVCLVFLTEGIAAD